MFGERRSILELFIISLFAFGTSAIARLAFPETSDDMGPVLSSVIYVTAGGLVGSVVARWTRRLIEKQGR